MNSCDILEYLNTSQRCGVARGPQRPGCFLEKVAILSLLKGDIRINTRMALLVVVVAASYFTEHYTVPANPLQRATAVEVEVVHYGTGTGPLGFGWHGTSNKF